MIIDLLTTLLQLKIHHYLLPPPKGATISTTSLRSPLFQFGGRRRLSPPANSMTAHSTIHAALARSIIECNVTERPRYENWAVLLVISILAVLGFIVRAFLPKR